MKKKLALVLVLALAALAFAACGGGEATPPEEETPEAPATGAVKPDMPLFLPQENPLTLGMRMGLPKLTPPSWQLPWMMKVLSPTV